MSFNYWIITTRVLDYSRVREQPVYNIYIYIHTYTYALIFPLSSAGVSWWRRETACSYQHHKAKRYMECLEVCLLKGKENLFLFVKGDLFRILSWDSSPFFTAIWDNIFGTISKRLPSKSKLAIWAMDKKYTDLLRGYCWDESEWIDFCLIKNGASMMDIASFSWNSVDIYIYIFMYNMYM